MSNKFLSALGGVMFLAFSLSVGFIQTAPTQALMFFECPDGSTPKNGVCPKQPVAPTISCANVRCAANTQCIDTSTGPRCVPLQPQVPTCPNWSTYNKYTQRCEYQQPTRPYWPQSYWYQYQQPTVYSYQYPYYNYNTQPYQYQYYRRR